MQAGDRLICAFVDGRPSGRRFKRWFLHVTIVLWFRLDGASEAVADGLRRALQTIPPFEAVVAEQTTFGKRPVSLLRQPTPFTQVEAKVRSYLHKKRAWLVDETTKKRYDFRPHVTAQGERQLQDGDTFRCDRLYIVEQKGDYKEIVSEIRFGK